MSHEELEQKVDDIERKQFRSTYIKAGSVLLSAIIMSITIGTQLGDWSAWRKSTTEKVQSLESWRDNTQSILNARRADEIRNIKVKQPQ